MNNSAIYTYDFLQTWCAISNHEVMMMEKKLFFSRLHQDTHEWKALTLSSVRLAGTSMICSTYYAGSRIVTRDQISNIFEDNKDNFVLYVSTLKVIKDAVLKEVRLESG